jgi:hypothetical protein
MAKLKKVWSGKFTMISNEIFEDWRLSYKEIGLYCNMMKFPDDWDFSIRNLAARHREKRDAVKTGLGAFRGLCESGSGLCDCPACGEL